MAIKRSKRPVASARLERTARDLLEASTLLTLATVSPGGRPHANTAYFAWTPAFELVWSSAAGARHSRNIRANASAAVAVYDSTQTWGTADRGIQLFGTARELQGSETDEAEAVYAARFRDYRAGDLRTYRFYSFRTRRVKLFDEDALGGGRFVTARVARDRLVWERTEIYRSAA